jgi:hypothetical protein
MKRGRNLKHFDTNPKEMSETSYGVVIYLSDKYLISI